MSDTIYVLDLLVTGADLVTMNEDGLGSDWIAVLGSYDRPVEITLCALTTDTQTTRASQACYYDQYDKPHELLIFGVIENATGSRGRDVITGNERANMLWGEEVLAGPGAADTISGGAGNDTVMGGGGNDSAQGGLGGDRLAGQAGQDALWGDAGNDRLTGGGGADTLEGGEGADRFVFLRPDDSRPGLGLCDVISDFSRAQGDAISLAAMDGDLSMAGNQAFHLAPGGFSGQAGEVIQTVQGSDLVILGDNNGDGLADFALLLLGLTSVQEGDFLF